MIATQVPNSSGTKRRESMTVRPKRAAISTTGEIDTIDPKKTNVLSFTGSTRTPFAQKQSPYCGHVVPFSIATIQLPDAKQVFDIRVRFDILCAAKNGL